MRKLVATSALAFALLLPLSAVAGIGAQRSWSLEAVPDWQRVVLPGAWVAFDVPPIRAVDVRVETFHPLDRSRHIRETATVRVMGVERVRVDVWEARGAFELSAWFRARFGKELEGRVSVSTESIGPLGVPALHIRRSAGCGAASRDIVVARLAGVVVVVSLADAGDPDAVTIFDAVVATLDSLDDGRL